MIVCLHVKYCMYVLCICTVFIQYEQYTVYCISQGLKSPTEDAETTQLWSPLGYQFKMSIYTKI